MQVNKHCRLVFHCQGQLGLALAIEGLTTGTKKKQLRRNLNLLNVNLEKNGQFIFRGYALTNKIRQCIVVCVKKAVDQTFLLKDVFI